MKNSDYIKLCVKDITGELGKAEKEELNQWLNLSDENRREYETIKSLWRKTTPQEIKNIPDIDDEWYSLSSELNLYGSEPERESAGEKIKSRLESFFPTILKPIGVAAVFALLTIIAINIFTDRSIEYKFVEIETANAQTEKVILPDGSTVTLNSASTLSFSEPFKEDMRLVQLEGEAYFSVSKNDIPFIIQTNNAEVSVLGTEFNVWSRSIKTKVIVKEGKVAFSTKSDTSKEVILTKDEASEIVADSSPVKPQKVDSDYLIGWLNSELVFDRTPLNEVVTELEKFYDISISIDDDTLKKLSLTGSFKNDDPDSVLSMIALTLSLEVSKTENEYKITTN